MCVNDRELIRDWLQGDVAAFEALVDRHQASLLRFATRLTARPDVAQDIVQETFLRAVREAQSLAQVECPHSWLLRVCRNLATDHRRKEQRMRTRQQIAAVPEAHREVVGLEVEDERTLVRSLLGALDPADREVLELKVYDGLSYRKIQAVTGRTLHQVHTAIHRGLRRIAAGLRAADAGPGVRS